MGFRELGLKALIGVQGCWGFRLRVESQAEPNKLEPFYFRAPLYKGPNNQNESWDTRWRLRKFGSRKGVLSRK